MFAVLKRVKAEVKDDNVSLLAAGVAFYAMLAIVPAVAASVARWVVLAVLVLVALAVVYRWGPDRANPHWRWLSIGAVVALVLWLLGSAGFSFYVDNFGKYNQTYGALAAVIILLLWLYLSAFAVLLGAEVDAGTERQMAADTTTGQERPPGRRGAEVADDTLGESVQRR